MTRKKEYLTDYIESRIVTFSGGVKSKVFGIGTLNVERMPKLKNVLNVEGIL